MPLFYFDVYDNGQANVDEVGTELPDIHAARTEAVATLTSIADDRLPDDGPERDIAIDVRDADGKRIMRVSIHFEIQQAL